jgi:hypothetical protein
LSFTFALPGVVITCRPGTAAIAFTTQIVEDPEFGRSVTNHS